MRKKEVQTASPYLQSIECEHEEKEVQPAGPYLQT